MSESRHSKGDLEQMQSLPLRIKITMTERRIFDWYEYWGGDVYLSFSGGKDSTVLKHIIDNMGIKVPSVFVNTGLEYPEIQKFAKEQENVTVTRPKTSFVDVVRDYGYPIISKQIAKDIEYARKNKEGVHYKKLFGMYMYNGEKSRFNADKWKFLFDAPFNISSRCCDVIKKKPIHDYEKETKRKPIVATMAAESVLRKTQWIRSGCNTFEGRAMSRPMSFWTEQDVLHYIKEYNVPYCSVYGDIRVKPQSEDEDQITFAEYMNQYDGEVLETTGMKRTGCMFCMFGCHLEKCPNRFQRMKETHPRQYEYCIGGGEMVEGKWQPNKQGLGLGFVLDYIGVEY